MTSLDDQLREYADLKRWLASPYPSAQGRTWRRAVAEPLWRATVRLLLLTLPLRGSLALIHGLMTIGSCLDALPPGRAMLPVCLGLGQATIAVPLADTLVGTTLTPGGLPSQNGLADIQVALTDVTVWVGWIAQRLGCLARVVAGLGFVVHGE